MSIQMKSTEYALVSRECLGSRCKSLAIRVNDRLKPKSKKKYQRRNDVGFTTLKSVNFLFLEQIDQIAFQTELLKYGYLLDIKHTTKRCSFTLFENSGSPVIHFECYLLDDGLWYLSILEILGNDVISIVQNTTRCQDLNMYIENILYSILSSIRTLHLKYMEVYQHDYTLAKQTEKLNKIVKILTYFKYLKKGITWDAITPEPIQG